MTDDYNIEHEGIPRFPIEVLETCLFKQRITRDDYYLLYGPSRRWQEYIETLTPHDLRLQRKETEMIFADYKLSEEQKAEAVANYGGDIDKVLDAMDAVTISGYRVTFSYDRKNNCAIVSLIGRDVESANYDKCMTTRHGSVRMALIFACYKQIFVFADLAWQTEGNESMWG